MKTLKVSELTQEQHEEDVEVVLLSDVEELGRELLTWCVMAYMGNAGERQALQAIRTRLERFGWGVVKS